VTAAALDLDPLAGVRRKTNEGPQWTDRFITGAGDDD
jgi:hypothetical protein